jgi:hypothetical protein
MIRKTIIAIAAAATVAGVALAPTAASAFPKHHHWGHGYWGGFGLGIVDVAPVSDCYLVQTRSGRYVQVCN